MKISHICIQNFKTFDSEGINFSMTDLTTLVGENSAGKSNVLEALDLFFNFSRAKISKRSFHHNDLSKTIVIEVTFCNLTSEEKKTFKIHLDENGETLTITQKIGLQIEDEEEISDIEEGNLNFTESKHGTKWTATTGYEWAELESKNPTKAKIKKWWEEDLIVDDVDFKSFFTAPDEIPEPAIYQQNLKRLWTEAFDKIPKEKKTGDDKVLGWKNKLKGNLPKFFYLPAIKHIEDDLKVLKANPFGEMIGWLSHSISGEFKKKFEDRTQKIVQKVLAIVDKDENGESKVDYLNKRLNENLVTDLDCQLSLRFGTPSIGDIIFPSPRLYADDGYESEISLKGHGVQRLSMFSLLRTYTI